MVKVVRVRQNLGVWKLSLDDSVTLLSQLKERIFLEHKIPVESQILSRDIEGVQVLEPDDATLESIGIEHGTLIYLKGKIEKTVVQKSYIGKNSEIVSAGVSLNIKQETLSAENEPPSLNDDLKRKETNGNLSQEEQKISDTKKDSLSNSYNGSTPYHTDDPDYIPPEFLIPEEEPEVRAPDKPVVSNLLYDDIGGQPTVV